MRKVIKQFFLILIIDLLIIGCGEDEKIKEIKNEGTQDSPIQIQLGNEHEGMIGQEGISYYTFTPDKSGSYKIHTSHNQDDVVLSCEIKNPNLVEETDFFPEGTVLFDDFSGLYLPNLGYSQDEMSMDFITGNLTKQNPYLLVVRNDVVRYTSGRISLSKPKVFSLKIEYEGTSEGSLLDPVILTPGTIYSGSIGQSTLWLGGLSFYQLTAAKTSYQIKCTQTDSNNPPEYFDEPILIIYDSYEQYKKAYYNEGYIRYSGEEKHFSEIRGITYEEVLNNLVADKTYYLVYYNRSYKEYTFNLELK